MEEGKEEGTAQWFPSSFRTVPWPFQGLGNSPAVASSHLGEAGGSLGGQEDQSNGAAGGLGGRKGKNALSISGGPQAIGRVQSRKH